MSQSAAKRQRVSEDRYISRATDNTTAPAHSNPTTPTRRASYLSPTKASLARSHPKLLTEGRHKAISEPRKSALNDKLHLAQAVATNTTSRPQNGTEPVSQNKQNRNAVSEIPQNGSPNEARDLAVEIAQVFRDLPIESERERSTVQQSHKPQQESEAGGRKPLGSSQPRATRRSIRGDRWLRDEADDPIEAFLPKLVKRTEGATQAAHASNEVDLPPTPVQLGLSAVPHRPRGLASSSSGGSRSGGGSGRHRIRVMEKENGSVTSSPLKPRPVAKALQQSANRHHSSRESPEEDSEDDAGEDAIMSAFNLSDEAKQKQLVLSELRQDLEALQKELRKLEKLSAKLKGEEELEVDADTTKLLVESHHHKKDDLLEIDRTFVTGDEACLQLFAPAGLRLDSTTRAVTVSQEPKIVHSLTFAAPPPWPASTLQLSIEVTIDAKKACIESVVQSGALQSAKHKPLQRWIDKRLTQPLHKYDVGSLISGSGNYLEACIERARTLQTLKIRHDDTNDTTRFRDDTARITYSEAVALSSYLDITQLTLGSSAPTERTGDVSKGHRKQILITYDLELTWTGTVTRKIQIACSGIGVKTQKSAQDLFQKLIKTESVLIAFESVWRLLGYDTGTVNGIAVSSREDGQAKRSRPKVKAG